MYCSDHPETIAVGTCSDCGKPICHACSLSVNGQLTCKACASKRLAGNINDSSAYKKAARGQKKNDTLPMIALVGGVVIVGMVLLVVTMAVFAAVVAVFLLTTPTSGQVHPLPAFNVSYINDTAVKVTFVDMGGATSIKGLIVEQPLINWSTIVDPNTEIDVGDSYVICDPKLAGTRHIVAASIVDDDVQVVIDTDV